MDTPTQSVPSNPNKTVSTHKNTKTPTLYYQPPTVNITVEDVTDEEMDTSPKVLFSDAEELFPHNNNTDKTMIPTSQPIVTENIPTQPKSPSTQSSLFPLHGSNATPE